MRILASCGFSRNSATAEPRSSRLSSSLSSGGECSSSRALISVSGAEGERREKHEPGAKPHRQNRWEKWNHLHHCHSFSHRITGQVKRNNLEPVHTPGSSLINTPAPRLLCCAASIQIWNENISPAVYILLLFCSSSSSRKRARQKWNKSCAKCHTEASKYQKFYILIITRRWFVAKDQKVVKCITSFRCYKEKHCPQAYNRGQNQAYSKDRQRSEVAVVVERRLFVMAAFTPDSHLLEK